MKKKKNKRAAAHGEEQVKTPLRRHICVFMSEVQPKKERKKRRKTTRDGVEGEEAEFG